MAWAPSGTLASVTSFLDNVGATDLAVGTLAGSSSVVVHLGLWQSGTGKASAYRVTIAASSAGVDSEIVQIDSDSPVTSVSVSALNSGGTLTIRLSGTGTGDTTDARYTVTSDTRK